MELSNDQLRVYNALCHFVKSDKQVFILQGSAGTGKTTLLAEVVNYLNEQNFAFQLMAPTGRAAHILGKKTASKATTIHKGIYDFDKLEVKINEDDISRSEFKFHYPIKLENDIAICIVDEGSMIGNHYSEGEMWTFGSNRLLDDLCTFAKLEKGGKLIVIGDLFQLPPVKEHVSLALTADYYEAKGLMVVEERLIEIFRQNNESEILKVADKMRNAMKTGNYTRLNMQEGDEMITLNPEDVPQKYVEMFPEPKLGNSVVISYSNAIANSYNEKIRQLMYGELACGIQKGDLMIVVSNNYGINNNSNSSSQDVMNGEFIQVLEFSNHEERNIPIHITGELKHIKISFVDAVVQLMSGDVKVCKMITEPILSAPKGTVSLELLKALYIDFCIRNRDLCKRPQSDEFKKAIQLDPYVNALRVRYGYSITGHKSQGGEWDTVFVDYQGVHFNEVGAHWMYTASTRARKKLYAINFVNITPMYSLKINTIIPTVHKNEYYPLPLPKVITTSPFHNESHQIYLKNKYAEIVARLENTNYVIDDIKHLPYRERYILRSSDGVAYQIDWMYNGSGVFRPATITPSSKILDELMNKEFKNHIEYPPLEYEPSNSSMQYLFDIMCNACGKADVDILNVVERLEHYQVFYCLRTSCDFAWITFFVNAAGLITYGAPQAADMNDLKLNLLIDYIKKIK